MLDGSDYYYLICSLTVDTSNDTSTLYVLILGVSPVKLDRLEVPPVIQNGTVDHVVLDCPYTLEPGERDGIVLKWYLNSNTVPIYQWIPPSHPQVRRVDYIDRMTRK